MFGMACKHAVDCPMGCITLGMRNSSSHEARNVWINGLEMNIEMHCYEQDKQEGTGLQFASSERGELCSSLVKICERHVSAEAAQMQRKGGGNDGVRCIIQKVSKRYQHCVFRTGL